jgi:hypothetical protein
MFFLLFLFISFALFEIVVRLILSPSQFSYGRILDRELPPIKLIPAVPPSRSDRSEWYNNLLVRGRRITFGDLWGLYREDPLLGYTPQENALSSNTWWQSNNVGARARYDTPKQKQKGRSRIIVFGDSFTSCSRVPHEETWPAILDSQVEWLEVINFGVDGYSMTQSFLRYHTMKNRIEYDLVILMFVPSADLWREINTMRILKEPWDNHLIMPRFILENDTLKLINSPYKNGPAIYESNKHTLSEQLKNHLRTYDQFYCTAKYENSSLLSNFISYKIFATIYCDYRKRYILKTIRRSNSEAMQISKKIFKMMNDEVLHNDKRFVLVILPLAYDLMKLNSRPSYQTEWDEMVSSICTDNLLCIDLTEEFGYLTQRQPDRGYDGSHYGPQANKVIANLIRDHLVSEGMLPEK